MKPVEKTLDNYSCEQKDTCNSVTTYKFLTPRIYLLFSFLCSPLLVIRLFSRRTKKVLKGRRYSMYFPGVYLLQSFLASSS